jgi:Zn-dependent protease with chaperone function
MRSRTLVASLVLLLAAALVPLPHAAAGAPAAPPPAMRADSVTLARTLAGASAPVAKPAAAPARARDYLAEARAAYTPENRAYATQRVVLNLVGPLYGILLGLLVMFTGLAARYRDIAEGLGHRLYVRVLVFFTLYSSTVFVLGLPLAWFQDFALEHQYGLSAQSLGDWLLDSLKGQVAAIVIVGVVPLLSLAWGVIVKHPRRWWLWLAVGTLPVALAATLLEPIVLDPIFNKFTTLEDYTLRYEILQLGSRAGIPARNVYQVDMSKRTRKLNAYVNGFGASQRIVIWDTTLKRMKRDEILFVMGHEMGHYVIGHIWKFLALLAVSAFFVFWLCARLSDVWLGWFGRRWGVRSISDLAAMPVIAISLTMATMLVTPVFNAASRQAEHEADVFGLEITRDNDAAARSFLKLAQDNRSDPDPPAWIRILLFDHPPLADRIGFALSYHPWTTNAPNRFFREHTETLLHGRPE